LQEGAKESKKREERGDTSAPFLAVVPFLELVLLLLLLLRAERTREPDLQSGSEEGSYLRLIDGCITQL